MVNQMIRIPEGCVLWLDLTEDTGDIVYDHSGHGNNGRVYGAILEKRLPFIGRYFDGVDDYVEVPDSPSLRISNEMTFVFWVKPLTLPSVEGAWGIVFKSGEYLIRAQATDEWAFFVYDGSDYEPRVQGGIVEQDKFTMITAVMKFDGTYIKKYLYQDAELVAREETQTGDIAQTTNSVLIGGYGGYYGKQVIGEVRFYNRALTAREIKYLYEETQKRVFRRIAPLNIRMR